MIHFPGQRENETIHAVIRKHPIVYVRISLAFLLTVILPLSIFATVWFRFFPLETHYRYGLVAGLGMCFYLLFGLVLTYIRITDEEFDVIIVTNDRLIDITQISFFSRSVSSAPLEQIQDVTGSIQGLLPTLLHYGDMTVKTSSAETSTFTIDHIADPMGIAHKVLDWSHQKKQAMAH